MVLEKAIGVKNLARWMLMVAMVCGLFGCVKETDVYKSMTAQEIYERGKTAALKKNYPQAIRDFDALEARYPYGEYTDKGQLALIHAYAHSNDEGAALAAADRFIRVHPRHPNVDFAYYIKGVVNFDENFSMAFKNLPLDRSMRSSKHALDAFDDFHVLLEKFPHSRYAPDARRRMILLREQLADHELHIAQYYVKQDANLAAANRAGYIVNQYPQTAAAREALKIMADSYKAMKMPQQAEEAKEALAENMVKD